MAVLGVFLRLLSLNSYPNGKEYSILKFVVLLEHILFD